MSYDFVLPEIIYRDIVEKALAEDLGSGGDITSGRLIQQEIEISAEIVARQQGVLAGSKVADLVFEIDE